MFKKVFFAGTPQFSASILEGIMLFGITISGVISMPDKPVGRKQLLTNTPVKKVAIENNIPVFQPLDKTSLAEVLYEQRPDVIIVVAYGMIFTKQLVDDFFLVNIHTSLLPKYRGPSPIQAALLNGDSVTGVTLMKIGYEIDDGDIVAVKKVSIDDSDNIGTLSERLEKISIELLVEQFALPVDHWNFEKQNEQEASYTKKLKKADGQIDFQKDEPKQIIDKLRAYTPWPGVFVIKNNKRIKILDAEIVDKDIILKIVQMEGKKPVSYAEFVNTYGALV